jgi:hypothetical protein
MRRRALLASIGPGVAAGLAGCAVLGSDDTVGDGDVVDLAAGAVTLGHMGFQSSFVDDTTAPATAHATEDGGYVTLDCDIRGYDAPVDDLPVHVEFDDERVSGSSGFRVSGAGDGIPRLGLPVPTGDVVESGAVVLETAGGNERRYPLDDRIRQQLATPPGWRVDVDAPDTFAAPGSARAWVTATNTGDTQGRLGAVLTHDDADELYWSHEFEATPTDDDTFGFRFSCLCTDRDELAVTIDWGVDAWTGTVVVES